MKKTGLEKIKGDFYIYSNGEYAVISGARLYIFKHDGTLIACRSDLRNAGRITFLSDNRMLLCSSKAVFHMINLRDGSDIWTVPYVKCNLNVNPVAISPDEAYAYTYDEYRDRHFITRLFLTTQDHEVETWNMYMDSGATRDIICDDEGIPCMLKTLGETIGGKRYQQSGVRIHDFYYMSPGATNIWKTKWSFKHRTSIAFFGSTDYILTNDLCIYEPATGALSSILDTDTYNLLPQQAICNSWIDVTGRYLCLMYQNGNAVIDLQERRIAAQYAAKYTQGCLIGDEYWICINERIHRKPFPSFEDIPPIKGVINSDWYYSTLPELW